MAMEGAGEEMLGMLLVSTGKQVADRVKSAFDAENLRLRHGELLKVLAEGAATTQQQLVEALAVDPSVLVGLLNELERDGLIRRIRDPKDRRRHLVEISAKGLRTLHNVFDAVHVVEHAVFKDLTDDDRQSLRRLLISIRGGLAQVEGSSEGCDDRA